MEDAAGVLRARIAAVDVKAARDAFPGVFQQWRSGTIRPFWLRAAVHASPGGAADLAAVLKQHVSIIDAWGSGELYPGWDAVCMVAAAAGVTVGDLDVSGDELVAPASGDALTDAIAVVMAAEYQADVFEVAKAFRGNQLGIPETAREAERAETVRKRVLTEVAITVYQRSGGQLAAGAPDDPVEALIFTRYEQQIRAFQQALFAEGGDSTAQIDAHQHETHDQRHRAGRLRAATIPGLGPVDAVNDVGVRFLFTADFSAERQATGDLMSANTVLTLSASARQTGTEDRIPVPPSVLPWVHPGRSLVQGGVDRA